MEIKFISDGKYLNLEPESERVILKKNHFHVHAAHHIICRELYAKQKQETKEKQQQELMKTMRMKKKGRQVRRWTVSGH